MGLIQALLLSLVSLSHATPSNPFETEPTFEPEVWEISPFENHRSELAPGYIFVSPLIGSDAWGPQIYDVDGNLVFSTGRRRVQDFKVCDFLGEKGTHLCWHQSRFQPGADPRIQKRQIFARDKGPPSRPVGKKLVFDNTYSQAGIGFTKGIGQGKTKNWPNGHEYNMLPGGESFLQAVYRPMPKDLRQYTGTKKGWILDGCFQERSVHDGELVYEWCFSDHFPLWETHLFFVSANSPNITSGKAGHGVITDPWDFMHINAVDKTIEGDYLISGRHLDQILKIAGPNNVHGVEPGSPIWRLGGRSNDFEILGNFSFSKQHDVRIISTTADETIFSIFDNAWEGVTDPSAKVSSGMIIAANNRTMQARLLHQYSHPEGLLARAMGSMQVLPNKNAFVGWGASPQLTEFSENGTVLWHAWYEQPFRNITQRAPHHNIHEHDGIKSATSPLQEWSYRSFKFPWVGKPFWSPKLVAYRFGCSTRQDSPPLLAYVSWNGATEVRTWRFSLAPTRNGLRTSTTITAPKRGFETRVDLSSFAAQHKGRQFLPWVTAEALDDAGLVLGKVSKKIFVPVSSIRHRCNHGGCRANDTEFRYPPKLNGVALCKPAWSSLFSLLMRLVPLVALVELVEFLGRSLCRALVYPEFQAPAGRPWTQAPAVLSSGWSEPRDTPAWLALADQESRIGTRDTPRARNYTDAPDRYNKKE